MAVRKTKKADRKPSRKKTNLATPADNGHALLLKELWQTIPG